MESGEGADQVASQLQSLISRYASEGWEFDQLSAVNIEVKPGCLGKLLGHESDYVRYDQVVFRKQVG